MLGSLKGVAIGARCPGRTEGSVHYPCAFDLDVHRHGDTDDALHGWISTTTYKLERPGEGTVSALSTRRPQPGSIALVGESGLLALIAPAALDELKPDISCEQLGRIQAPVAIVRGGNARGSSATSPTPRCAAFPAAGIS